MVAGTTTTSSLADSLDDVRSSARRVREQAKTMTSCVDRKTLGRGIGLSWQEVQMEHLTAQPITETTVLDNPQQLEDNLLTITPTQIGIETLVTWRVAARINRKAFAQTGRLAQNAIERKKDEDGLAAIDGATTQLGAAGSALVTGNIRAAKARITSNTSETAPEGPIFGVFHGFQIKDWEDEILSPTSGALDQQLEDGTTSNVFMNGGVGKIGGVVIKEDGNITIDGAADAKGGVFHRDAIVLVQGRAPTMFTKQRPEIGGGATSVYQYDEYAYGERSAGNWLYELIGDATTPTS